MQVFTLKPRSLGASILALWFMLMSGHVVLAQGGWTNDEPIWQYEDETPTIDAAILIKLHNVTQTYNIAGEYHNKHFIKEYHRREGENKAFQNEWAGFLGLWIAWNYRLDRYTRAVAVDASQIRVGEPIKNFETMQLRGQALTLCKEVVETARDLTFYLEDDTVIRKWEIFIRRLEYMEDAVKELED